ncbi:DNA polymerase alpha/epsilon subunit B [Nitzschia inconspicua]|uniref:DNA polymerase alpha/epsilon subunit B n=1 Tax=Nitzschia inconspicua TaxID=303405 RepID=A0A9K3Q359_9STRA|nr:DNA polymerase alpha/epsilon subunit B [Nitzschia inconspicua]
MTATVQSSTTTSPVVRKSGGSTTRHTVVRAWASRTPKWQRFQPVRIQPNESTTTSVESKQKEVFAYQRQYSHVYHHRLMALRDRCWKQLAVNDGTKTNNNNNSTTNLDDSNPMTAVRVNRILELKEDQLSRVVGTLVKETINSDEELLHPKATCRPSDQLYLEDESGRVILSLDGTRTGVVDHQVYQFCTGVVIGVEGMVDDKGVLHVQYLATPAPLPPPTALAVHNTAGILEPSQPAGYEPHLLLVSSLECGDPQVSSLPRELLVGYLQGQFTDEASKVARVIVAGSGPSATDPLGGLKELDMFAGIQVSGGSNGGVGMQIPLDILPSSKDPTTANWPQRPLHSSLLPLSNKDNQRMVMSTPNPYEAIHGTKSVMGTDGLNVRDLQKHILKPNPNDKDEAPVPLTELEALEQTLRWAHLCPTGPDHLGMVPSNDPMEMGKTTPHVYFCGNCEEGFATKLLGYNEDEDDDDVKSKTRLVCIPKFSETGEAVLVNLRTLDVELIRFKVEEEEEENSN